MASLNRAGLAYARSLIAAGKVNRTSSWSWDDASDGNALLGVDKDWANYGKHHLGVTAENDKTKAHWRYPFAKGGKIYRSAVIAIRDRAGQQKDTEILDAAGKLLKEIDKKALECGFEEKTVAFDIKTIDSENGTFTGYGAVFGNVDHGGDLIRQGAFSDSLNNYRSKGKMPKMLWQHDPKQPIGVYTNMQEDDHGLLVHGKFTKGVQKADEAYALMKDGALDGLSIGYRTKDADYDPDLGVRSLKKLDLLEVSPVTFPMNESATVTAVKSITTIREFEDFLRDEGGFSHAAAKAIAASGFKAFTSQPRDEGEIGDTVASFFQDLAKRIHP